MHNYKVRAQDLSFFGPFGSKDHYQDYTLTSEDPLPVFTKKLAAEGFDNGGGRWIMPGAIIWVEPE